MRSIIELRVNLPILIAFDLQSIYARELRTAIRICLIILACIVSGYKSGNFALI